jgi:hypothetical protein
LLDEAFFERGLVLDVKRCHFVPVREVHLVVFQQIAVKSKKNIVPSQFDVDIQPVFLQSFLVNGINVPLDQLPQLFLSKNRFPRLWKHLLGQNVLVLVFSNLQFIAIAVFNNAIECILVYFLNNFPFAIVNEGDEVGEMRKLVFPLCQQLGYLIEMVENFRDIGIIGDILGSYAQYFRYFTLIP